MKLPPVVLTIDGIDGSGKKTLADMVRKFLENRNFKVYMADFPQYETFTGRAVKHYLDTGYDKSTNRMAAATLYSADRNFYWMSTFDKFFSRRDDGPDYVIMNRNWTSNVLFHTALLTAKPEELFQVEPVHKFTNWLPAMTLAEWYHLLVGAGRINTGNLWTRRYMESAIASAGADDPIQDIRSTLVRGALDAKENGLTPHEFLTRQTVTNTITYGVGLDAESHSVHRPLLHEDWDMVMNYYHQTRIGTIQLMLYTLFVMEIMPWFCTDDLKHMEFRSVVLTSSSAKNSEHIFLDNMLKRYNGDTSKLDVHERSNDYLGAVVENVHFIYRYFDQVVTPDHIFRGFPQTQLTGVSKFFDYNIVHIDKSEDDASLRGLDDEFEEVLQKLGLAGLQ